MPVLALSNGSRGVEDGYGNLDGINPILRKRKSVLILLVAFLPRLDDPTSTGVRVIAQRRSDPTSSGRSTWQMFAQTGVSTAPSTLQGKDEDELSY